MVRKYTATRFRKKGYKKNVLRKGNIFKNKSSRSQARQIYALNKKVNYIQKTTKPEMCLSNSSIVYHRFTSSNMPVNEYHDKFYLYRDNILPNITINGDMFRVKFIKLFGMFGIYNDTTLEGEWSVSTSKNLVERQPMSAYIRIVVCRLKQAGMSYSDVIQRITTPNPRSDDNDLSTMRDLYPINGPLIEDITSNYKILKNKVIKVSNNNAIKSWSIKLSSKQLGWYYKKSVSGPTTFGQNEIIVYWQYVQPATLRYENPTSQISRSIGPQGFFTCNHNNQYYNYK